MIKIVAYKSTAPDATFVDKLISFWTGCKYSHVLIIIDKISYEVSPKNKKVVRYETPYFYENNRLMYDFFNLKIKINKEQSAIIEEQLDKELGKKYDWLGIFLSQILPLKRNDKNKWFCSEFVAYALNLIEKTSDIKIKLRKQPQCYSPCALIKELIEKKII